MENTKVCTKCGKELPLSEFNKNKSRKDGLQAWCKECVKQYKFKWEAEHAEERAAYRKQYYAEHKEERKQYRDEHKEEIKQYMDKYCTEHKEEKKQYMSKYYAEHKEERKQYHAEWRSTIEGYAYQVRYRNLQADRDQGRCGKDEDPLPSLEYYIWALQQRDFYDGKQYPFDEMGLDRIYNDKPHTFANVVPCSTANNKRRRLMSFEEFRELIRK